MFACRRTNGPVPLAPTAVSFHVEVGSGPPRGPRGGEFCGSSAKQICRRIVLLASVQNKASKRVYLGYAGVPNLELHASTVVMEGSGRAATGSSSRFCRGSVPT